MCKSAQYALQAPIIQEFSQKVKGKGGDLCRVSVFLYPAIPEIDILYSLFLFDFTQFRLSSPFRKKFSKLLDTFSFCVYNLMMDVLASTI